MGARGRSFTAPYREYFRLTLYPPPLTLLISSVKFTMERLGFLGGHGYFDSIPDRNNQKVRASLILF